MARIGDRSAPDLAQSRIGNIQEQLGQRLTVPERCLVTELGAWLRGITGAGSIAYRLVLWSWGGSVGAGNAKLGQTAQHTTTAAAFDPGNLIQQIWPLEDPVELDAGATIMVGFSSSTAAGDGAQWGIRSGAGTHYAKDLAGGSSWPVSMKGSYTDSHDLAAWVEAYTPLAAAWIRRAGAWVRADDVTVRRGGAWASASAIDVRRSGGWTDAS